MNTCQTSIKADILFNVAVAHILGLSDQHKITTFGSHRTDLSGGSGRQTKDLRNTYSRSTAETIMNPIGQNIPVINLSTFGNYNQQPRQFLN